MEVKIGQVWEDKDLRRDTRIEVIKTEATQVLGLVVGTEEERWYKVERLVKRWRLVREAPAPKPKRQKVTMPPVEPVSDKAAGILLSAPQNWQLKAVCSVDEKGQVVRITNKQAETHGMPLCGCHHKPMRLTERNKTSS